MSDGPLYRDPWAKREAWRKNPIFSKRTMFRGLFPGFGTAVVAFTAYLIFENLSERGKKKQVAHH
jgi:NADH dehydrogenase (ubiquinone) 1 beta subcomplex subunit 3